MTVGKSPKEISEETFETALAHSFKNFHAKGFDYLCLRRTPELTEKVYFFRGKSDQLHDVVNPHNHRYDFRTECLAGEVVNHTWVSTWNNPGWDRSEGWVCADYRTPLNGGDGFTVGNQVGLKKVSSPRYSRGESYYMEADEIHTISIRDDTVIKLYQFADVVPVGVPTQTFSKNPDSLVLDDGLYERFTADELVTRFRWLEEIEEKN